MTALERFQKGFIPVPESGCWLWLKASARKGYGVLKVSGRMVLAHRFAYSSLVGPIPHGKFVLHTCDVTCCVRPNHLWLGTAQDNARDMVRKGRKRGGWQTPSGTQRP